MSQRKRVIGRGEEVDIIAYGKALVIRALFKYADRSGQGFARGASIPLLKAFMNLFAVEALQDAVGKSCWVTASYESIHKLEPIFEDEGGPAIDFDTWNEQQEEIQECATSSPK